MENFNELFNVEDLKNSLNAAKENTPEYKDVVPGTYEVKIEKCELAKSKTNKPMCKIRFRIIGGDFDNQCLFYNKVLVGVDNEGKLSAMPLHFNNEFLKSLKVFADEEIVFNDFNDYAGLLLDIADEAEQRNMSFKLQYSIKNDFGEFKILDVYHN